MYTSWQVLQGNKQVALTGRLAGGDQVSAQMAAVQRRDWKVRGDAGKKSTRPLQRQNLGWQCQAPPAEATPQEGITGTRDQPAVNGATCWPVCVLQSDKKEGDVCSCV